jgi:hypothetical protein
VSDLQDIIASNTVRAYNAGYDSGKRAVLDAVRFVSFELDDLTVAAISDIEDELQERANSYHSNRQITLSEQGQEGNS